MTISNGYATLAEFKAWVTVRGGSTSTDSADDAVIEDIVEAVSRKIDNLTGTHFYKDTNDATRYFEAKSSGACEVFPLSAAPTTVSVDYNNTRTYTDFAASDFELEPVSALLDGKPYTEILLNPNSAQYFPTNRRGVKVVAKFGWPSVPDDIKDDCLAIAHNVWMNRSGQVGSGKMTVTAGGVVIRPEDIPAHVMTNLLTYRIFR